jgi:hypothetical protein
MSSLKMQTREVELFARSHCVWLVNRAPPQALLQLTLQYEPLNPRPQIRQR